LPINLDQVVPWGRSLHEYVRMFDLTTRELEWRILDCAGGPASFNAEMHRRGGKVISCDPIYRFSPSEIAARIDETYPNILEKTKQTRGSFFWHEMKSPDELGEIRMSIMKKFLADLPEGLAEGRYRAAELPSLPFRDQEFDCALCSHFLFTYDRILTLQLHLDAIRELCRVAREARVFPLVPNFGNARSPYLEPVVKQLTEDGCCWEIGRVNYEFQKGGNEMLKVSCRT
jgi:hypothetical protein